MRWILAPLALASAAPLHAETASGTIPVSLTVLPACRVETAPLAFAAIAGSGAEAQTPIAVACSSETEVSISLDGGRNATGTERQLASADGSTVSYAIYLDAARTRVWSQAAVTGEVAPASPLQLVAYGSVEGAHTAVAAGDYSDLLTVTVTF